jgi:hypothetical protein
MGLFQPLFLLGALALGLPVLLHLIHRQKYPSVRFSTLEFFQRTVKHNTLQNRLIDILLLALRILALALLVLAASRPFLSSPSGNASSTVVLVLDNSGSMSTDPGLAAGPATPFGQCQQRAEEIVRALRPEDRVAILPTVGPGLDPPTRDRDAAVQCLRSVRQEFVAGQVEQVMERANTILVESGEMVRHLVILTDGQAREWRRSPTPDTGSVLVTLFRSRPPPPANLAVASVRLSEEPAAAGVPVQITIEVANFGREATGPVKVELELRSYGDTLPPQMVRSIGPGERRTVSFHHVFHGRDLLGGVARVSGTAESYTADDAFYFVPPVRDVVRTLVINGVESPRAPERAAYFLARALQPSSESGSGGLSPVIVDETDLSQIAKKIFYDYAVVVTANVSKFPPKILPKFQEYLNHGGTWLVFLGDTVEPPAYNALGLLPGTLRSRYHPPMPVILQDLDGSHPALAWLALPGNRELTLFAFTDYLEFVPAGEETASVLASYSDGRPALVEGRIGDGRVLVFTSSAHTDWSDMPLRPAFLVLAQRLVEYLGHASGAEDVLTAREVGQTLYEPRPEGPFQKERQFVSPDGTTLEHRQDGDGIRSVPTRSPGIYFVQPQPDASAGTAGVVLDRKPYAVNVTLDESEPVYLTDEELVKQVGAATGSIRDPSVPMTSSTLTRTASEYTGVFLGFILLVLVVESLAGWRFPSESAK